MRGRKSGSWERVDAARRQARLALGKDPDVADLYSGRAQKRTALPSQPEQTRVTYGPGVRVLTVGEAATRLGISRAELEAMIDAGAVEALPTGFTRMIPTREVERLQPAGFHEGIGQKARSHTALGLTGL